MDETNIFGKNLKRLREANRLSMDSLADDLNNKYNTKISKSMISRWENGVSDPQVTYVAYLADYFKVDLKDLIGSKDDNLNTKLIESKDNDMPRHKISIFDQHIRRSITANLKRYIDKKGITQKELSEETDIPVTTISGYLRGKSFPDEENLEKIASALGVKQSDLDTRYSFMNSNDEIINCVDNLRRQQHLSLNELARRTGLAKSSLSRYFNKSRSFPVNKADLFAKALHTTPERILGLSSPYDKLPKNLVDLSESGIHYLKIPIIGTIACGEPITAEQNIEGYTHELFESRPSGTIFALRCKGNSMEPTIPDGAIVTIREQPEVEDGEIAAVQLHSDDSDYDVATLKRVKHTDGGVVLMPDNQSYSPIILNESSHARIIGKAIKMEVKL